MDQETIDRDAFLEALEHLFAEHEHRAAEVFADQLFSDLVQQYGEPRARHWLRLARMRNEHAIALASRASDFWGRLEQILSDRPAGTAVGDVMDESGFQRLAAECGLVVTSEGTFGIREDWA